MQVPQETFRFRCFQVLLLVALSGWCQLTARAQSTVLLYEGFEGSAGGWTQQDPYGEGSSRSIWELGRPSRTGPAAAYAGSRCAATEISGDYRTGTDAQWASPSIQIPSFADGSDAWLEFYQWHSYDSGDGDVEVLVWDAQFGEWGTGGLVHSAYGYSGGWQRVLVPLRDFGGERIRIAFNHYGGWSDDPAEPGWYIDEVRVFTRSTGSWDTPHSFESGLGDWVAMSSLWQVGPPAYGPTSVPLGFSCAATNRFGTYSRNTVALLVSPPVLLPTPTVAGADVWITYDEWVQYGQRAAGFLFVSSLEGERWKDSVFLSRTTNTDGAWQTTAVELTDQAGTAMRFALQHVSENETPAAGWYVDGVQIRVREPGVWNGAAEGFESGFGEWIADGGVWQVGVPGYGPAAAAAGAACVGTRVGGAYGQYASGRLVSPALQLPAAGTAQDLWLSLDHWVDYDADDRGSIQISSFADGAWGDWTTVATVGGRDTNWQRIAADLTAYAGALVRVGFLHEQLGEDPDGASAGWYLDNVGITIRPTGSPETLAEDFAAGLGGWQGAGSWRVGTPQGGPGSGLSDSACAFSEPSAAGPFGTTSRLVGPPVTIPVDAGADAWLRFAYWLTPTAAASGHVEVSTHNGTTWSDWQALGSNPLPATNSEWRSMLVDVTSYRGIPLRVSFRIEDNAAEGGFYVDDIALLTRQAGSWSGSGESFESGLGGWLSAGSAWEAGVPSFGPGGAAEGAAAAGTVLNGPYTSGTGARLISPPAVLPALSGPQDLWLTFRQWVAYASGHRGQVEISTYGGSAWGPWQVLGTVSGAASSWRHAALDLSTYAGRTVRLAFHHNPDGSSGTTAAGWYVDMVAFALRDTSHWNGTMHSFENGVGAWRPQGAWEIGAPAAPPLQAYEGSSSANLAPCSGCVSGVPQRLVSPPLQVTPAAIGGDLWLRYHYWLADADAGEVQVEISEYERGAWQSWTVPAAGILPGSGGAWGRAAVDLADYAGSTIRVGFRAPATVVASRWSVDAVDVIHRAPGDWDGALQGFENGVQDWIVEGGVWDAGVPGSGPGAAFSGNQCAGTVLGGTIPAGFSARLISPPHVLVEAVRDGEIWLEYAQWYAYDGGAGEVHVSVLEGAQWGPWQALSAQASAQGHSPGWVRHGFELSELLGKTVRFAFVHNRDNSAHAGAAGWYVDDVAILVRPFTYWDGALFGFEDGLGDWQSAEDNWDAGLPPGSVSVPEGQSAAYIDTGVDGRLLSPVIDLRESTLGDPLCLHFNEWHADTPGVGRTVKVSIRTPTGWSDWFPVSRFATSLGNSSGWRQRSLDLAPYAGQTIRLLFECTGTSGRMAGWALDAIEIGDAGGVLWEGAEDFEDDLAGWEVQGDTWQVARHGESVTGAFGGRQFALALAPDARSAASGRLSSPPLELPLHHGSVVLEFAERYESGDARILVNVWDGAAWGPDIPVYTPGSVSGQWTSRSVDLSTYGGQRIRLVLAWTGAGTRTEGIGWCVDQLGVVLDSEANRLSVAFPSGLVYRAVADMRLLFNRDMDTASGSGPQSLALHGPGGPLALSGSDWVSPRELQLRFAPQWRPGVYWVILDDSFLGIDGRGLDQNMDGAVEGAPTDLAAASFRIAPRESAPWQVDVAAGWNYISFPVSPGESVGELFGPLKVGPLWAWNAALGGYEPLADEAQIAPQVGHWVFTSTGGSLAGNYGIPGAGTLQLQAGWNAIGAAYPADAAAVSALPVSFSWVWDRVRNLYRPFTGSGLVPGEAYWMYSPTGGRAELP